jgi:hypothetical protein
MMAQLKVDALNLPLAPLKSVQQPPLASLANSLSIKLFGTKFHFMAGRGTPDLVVILNLVALLLGAIVLVWRALGPSLSLSVSDRLRLEQGG